MLTRLLSQAIREWLFDGVASPPALDQSYDSIQFLSVKLPSPSRNLFHLRSTNDIEHLRCQSESSLRFPTKTMARSTFANAERFWTNWRDWKPKMDHLMPVFENQIEDAPSHGREHYRHKSRAFEKKVMVSTSFITPFAKNRTRRAFPCCRFWIYGH